jgi:hypothetical protein
MLFWIIKIILLSIILIFLVHYLINFFKSTLTVPKIKDLVNTPSQKYENMFNIISLSNSENSNLDYNNNNNNNSNNSNSNSNQINYTEIDLLPKPDESSMKNELKSFLKKQMTTNSNENYNLQSYSDSNNPFSNV